MGGNVPSWNLFQSSANSNTQKLESFPQKGFDPFLNFELTHNPFSQRHFMEFSRGLHSQPPALDEKQIHEYFFVIFIIV